MKASVQYNDFVGTSAADISDYSSLNDYLESQGVDIRQEELNAIGIQFYAGYSNFFSYSIICEKGKDKKLVRVIFSDRTKEEFFNLFKRMEVIITKRYYSDNLDSIDDCEEYYIEDISTNENDETSNEE